MEDTERMPVLLALGEALSATVPTTPVDAGWELVECAVDTIAAHYRFDRDLVWAAVFELENSWEEQTGAENFGVLLDHPWGLATLGIRVAEAILDEDAAQALPLLMLSYH